MLAPEAPNAMNSVFALAKFVLLEALRTRLAMLVVCTLAVGLGLAGFLSQLALTERALLQAGVLAAFFRVSAVFISAAFVITSMVRESNDKGTELLLSLPLSRTSYYAGKLLGFAACGAIVAAVFSATMLLWCPPQAVGAWFASFVLEIWLVCAISLFFVVTLGDVVTSLASTAAMYLLSRVVSTIQSVSASPLAADDDAFHRIATWGIEAVALLLPPLDRATQTNWLLYGPPTPVDFAGIAASLFLYGALVIAAGLFDFHRRNL
jgi:ABC-type Na+ efflux pump permease subunit